MKLNVRKFCDHNHKDPEGWNHSWFLHGDSLWLDKKGRKNGLGRPWLRLVCALSRDCPALAFVQAEAIESAVASIIEAGGDAK